MCQTDYVLQNTQQLLHINASLAANTNSEINTDGFLRITIDVASHNEHNVEHVTNFYV